ncbi:hypothetical protein XENTR_v10013439 [Xenopus tropicalis]|nr:hypothetical protein XENTR_v10013439 [Xenopus tropicalis]
MKYDSYVKRMYHLGIMSDSFEKKIGYQYYVLIRQLALLCQHFYAQNYTYLNLWLQATVVQGSLAPSRHFPLLT